MGGKNLKSINHYKYLGAVLDSELSDDRHSETTAIKILCSKQAASLFSRGSNAVKNVLFRSFCKPKYASQLWWNFRKSSMQRLRVAYNCGCRTLYNLPWRAKVSSHDSLVGQVFATFATFFTASNSFLNTQNLCSMIF